MKSIIILTLSIFLAGGTLIFMGVICVILSRKVFPNDPFYKK